MKIKIPGLPDNVSGFLLGRIYVLVSHEKQLIRQIVSDTLVSQNNVALVSQKTPSQYLNQKAINAWEENQFNVLSLSTENTRSFKNKSQRFCDELDYFKFSHNDLLIIDPAEGLLTQDDCLVSLELLSPFQRWAQQNQCSLLIIFSELLHHPNGLANLIDLADHFAGIVRLDNDSNQPSWNVSHWFSHLGMQGKSLYDLSLIDNSLSFKAQLKKDQPSEQPVSSLDDDIVHITHTAMADARDVPELWVSYQNIDDLRQSVKGIVNATIVLDYTDFSYFEALLKHVFHLRQEYGNSIKIVVREMNAIIRHYHEQLLLRMGCNLIVPSSIGFSRFVSMLTTLDGQVFLHPLGDSFESEVNSIPPSQESGYLGVAPFLDSVFHTLKGMKITGVQGTLISFNMIPGVRALDVLRVCHIKRSGDVCTASESFLYVFLFACRESDVSLSLDSIFKLPVNELFIDQVRSSDVYSIEDVLAKLKMDAEQHKSQFIDYTHLLTLDIPESDALDSSKESIAEDVYKPVKPDAAIPSPLKMKVGVLNA